MPHSVFSWPGSGTIPQIVNSLPGGYDRGNRGAVRYRDADAVAIMNPEDLSAWMGPGSTRQVTLTPSTAERVDSGVEHRRSVAVANTSTTETIYVGFSDSITLTGATGGFPVFPQQTITLNCTNRYQVFAICGSAVVVGVMEVA